MEGEPRKDVSWWKPVLFAALAGGMGWGIRGQYGHELGAMVPGVLVCLTLLFLLGRELTSRQAARAVALGAIAMGIGGSMTYGQTVGLTQNAPVIGNIEAWRWGMLGLAVKGALWIGFGGAFLGIALGGKRYRPLEMLWCLLALIGAFQIGTAVLNSPFDPAHRLLPPIYFSASWHWQPTTELAKLKPRPECWGGLLFALATLLTYTTAWKKDAMPIRLALWGMLGGAVGFPGGQCLQSLHAWHPELYKHGVWTQLDPHMNWWNMMETTFGTIMGAFLGLGTWVNRKRIAPIDDTEDLRSIAPALAWAMLAVHVALLLGKDVYKVDLADAIYATGITLVILPIVAVLGGRACSYLTIFPVLLVPIAAETVQETVYKSPHIGAGAGWLLYFIIPVALSFAAAVWFARKGDQGQSGRDFTRRALVLCAWAYFLLNWAVFQYPWPWAQWTYRTPNGILFTISVLALTGLALFSRRGAQRTGESGAAPA